jgi:hypothetical protein
VWTSRGPVQKVNWKRKKKVLHTNTGSFHRAEKNFINWINLLENYQQQQQQHDDGNWGIICKIDWDPKPIIGDDLQKAFLWTQNNFLIYIYLWFFGYWIGNRYFCEHFFLQPQTTTTTRAHKIIWLPFQNKRASTFDRQVPTRLKFEEAYINNTKSTHLVTHMGHPFHYMTHMS